ncbi:MAG: YifB family Mg chelatase-like AAA ATPase [Johnsonella sp.]|nr:YifB family Mg chelatase-like AAA ATPase [Johnsonella sp.]
MLSNVYCAGLSGLEGFIVCCETDAGKGLPQISLIGYLAPEVREAADRVRTAIKNSGFCLAPKKVIINLSPADIRKEGCVYDLPIAVSILASYGMIDSEELKKSLFVGELALSGRLLPIRGSLSIAAAAKEAGFERIYLPAQNVMEAAAIEGIECYGIEDLRSLSDMLCKKIPHIRHTLYREEEGKKAFRKDFADIGSQLIPKRATMIAVGGRHHILYIGPAGTGKSMMAARIPGIMPGMSREERLEVSKIYSVCGFLDARAPIMRERPFRNPHHTISSQALSGGGGRPKPGEISLAHKGVLFLDELAEFKKDTLEVLRQPMEEGEVRIARVNRACTFPTDFMLVAATNPCKCGFYPDRSRCRCDIKSIRNYLGKISKPLLDRVDICTETRMLGYRQMKESKKGEGSEEMKKRVEEVRKIQQKRFQDCGILFNAQMDKGMIEKFCTLSKENEDFLAEIYEKKGMSMRSLHKVLKVARTIADFEGSGEIEHAHLCEAISYRGFEERYLGGQYNE